MKKILLLLTIFTFVLTVLLHMTINSFADEKATYVGDGACLERCHDKVMKSFAENIHNEAYTVLKGDERFVKLLKEGKEAQCLKCHSTGYGEESGFVDEETTPELAKVGCEGCHGPGSKHVAAKEDDKGLKRATIDRKPECWKCHMIHEHM